MISTLKSLSMKNRYLQSCWYEQFPWFSTACKKVLAITVNTLPRDKLLIFSKYAETIPIIYTTAERIFFSLKHLVTYFHSTNAEELTDSYDLISVVNEFVFISRKCR